MLWDHNYLFEDFGLFDFNAFGLLFSLFIMGFIIIIIIIIITIIIIIIIIITIIVITANTIIIIIIISCSVFNPVC